MKFKILENYYLLATKQKSNISKAMTSLITIFDKDQDYLPGVLALATGFMIEKNEVHDAMYSRWYCLDDVCSKKHKTY